MSVPSVAVIDFETEAILPRPDYPPRPVGVAISIPGMRPWYMAWGHPSENNCTERDAKRTLQTIWRGPLPLLMHHAKFDLDVAEEHLGLKPPSWDRFHDTLFLIFLQNPDRLTLSLKPVAEKELNLPPNERDAVRAWLVAKGIVKKNDGKWGRYISKAPGQLVGRYAIGDVVRTRKLFDKYYKEVVIKRNMAEAYDRERKSVSILLASERRGIYTDLRKLSADVPKYEKMISTADIWIRKRLRAPELDLDSKDELAKALQRSGKADESKWEKTKKSGKLSTKKTALAAAITDAPLLAALTYRATVAGATRGFLRPWLNVAQGTKGFIYTSWNQVAQDYHDSGRRAGTRTGRLSSNPNFQNITTNYEDKDELMKALEAMKRDATMRGWLALAPLPQVRSYIIARPGYVLLDRDYNQQELRILAHYEGGALLRAYQQDPWMDAHVMVQEIISGILGKPIKRKPIKVLNFGMIYGMGIGKLAMGMGLPIEVAQEIKRAHRKGLPDIKYLIDDLHERADKNLPIRTWGGREYFCEPPVTYVDEDTGKEKTITFEYKMLNTLIQPSAADNTKQAMINYDNTTKDGLLSLQVHDQLVAEAPIGSRVAEMHRLRDAMQACKFDVPMLSTGAWGRRWTELKELPKGE